MKNRELQIKFYVWRIEKFFFALCFFCGALSFVQAQSINQSYPTPITSNEISGKIAARDLGDARLTAYYYAFDGAQGDIFINVVTSNLNGDIDVFTADNLRPLTKITIYADASDSETGRVIYLRQPAKLILRIEGRTPNDDPANFRIKFAGSFVPLTAVAENTNSEMPEVKSNNQTDVRVNSVGTIIEVKPKPLPTPKATVARKTDKKTETISEQQPKSAEEESVEDGKIIAIAPKEKKSENQVTITIDKNAETTEETKAETLPTETKPTVIITDEIEKKEKSDTNAETGKENLENRDSKAVVKTAKKDSARGRESKETKTSNTIRPVPPAALENIRLIILFKDGSKIERPMSEVLKFGVDKGILTIISKDGAIGRYSILDVEKMTIE
jgi:hypothetical protein